MGQFRLNYMLIDHDYSSSESDVLLDTVVTIVRDVAVLQMLMHVCVCVITMLLLLLCGDTEMNPGSYTLECYN